MKVKQLSLLLGALIASSASFAGPLKSAVVQLGGGTLKPRESLSLPLNKLVPGAAYSISCKINDANNQKNNAIFLIESFVGDNGFSEIFLNGQQVNNRIAQVKLPQINNVVEINYQYSTGQLRFTNVDQDDTLVVSDCVANATSDNANLPEAKKK